MLEIRLLDWPSAQADAKSIRFTVFVDEQRVPAEIELDEHDAHCVHALAFVDGQPVGTGRLLPDGHIGRMAVLKRHRGKGVGRALLRALIESARQRGDKQVLLSAQVHAAGFYSGEGFWPEGPVYEEAGIAHQAMRRAL